MTYRHPLSVALLAIVGTVGGCSSDDEPDASSGTGGGSGAEATTAGGGNAPSGGNDGMTKGGSTPAGSASGGTSEPSGGTASGGSASGGISPGGTESTSGGATSGGAPSGGSASGGTETGGAPSGGSASGGTPSGGTASGETGGTATGGAATGGSANGWSLVWSDEFEGTSVDSTKWEHEVNCWGGGNNEDECYVADAKNSFLQDGALHIVALADNPSGAIAGPDNDPTVVTKGHSSARLRTLERGDWTYGRIEARARLPYGQGLWPAIWMLPSDSVYGGWAASGEIDIMEAVNLAPDNNLVYATLHYGGAWPDNTSTGTSTPPSTNAWEDFHLYAVEWEQGEIRWFVDERHYATQNDWFSSTAAYPAPFDQRFHLILNVAVGGTWPGPPDATTTFPQEMVIDYVRVYTCTADPATGHGCGTEDPSITPL